ncbi:MAG: diguanylate cyclase, partial [Gammaproteobacteria bacterium]|nr:diguanylate cyclase [Gammaproteobacteria bacterium]
MHIASHAGQKILSAMGLDDPSDSKKKSKSAFHSWQSSQQPQLEASTLFRLLQLLSYLDALLSIAGAITLVGVISLAGLSANLTSWILVLCVTTGIYVSLQLRRNSTIADTKTIRRWTRQHNASRIVVGIFWAYPVWLLVPQSDTLSQLAPLTATALLVIINTLTAISRRRYLLTIAPALSVVLYMTLSMGDITLWLATAALFVLAGVAYVLATLTEKASQHFVKAQISARIHLAEVENERDKLRQATEALNESEELFDLVANNASDVIVLHDDEARYLYANEALGRIFGYDNADVLGRKPSEFMHPDDREAQVDSFFERGLKDLTALPTRYRFKHRKGHYIWLESSVRHFTSKDGSLKLVSVSRDITKQIELEKDLHRRATSDAVTGVLNRSTFEELLDDAVKSVANKERTHALIYIDLDQFKIINDTSGHEAGDEMLAAVAKNLSTHVRDDDALARMGGDEFALLMYDCDGRIAQERCEEIRQSLGESRFEYDQRYYSMSASLGMVLIDQTLESGTTALQHADVACYVAKNNGRNAIHVWHKGDKIANKHLQAMDWVTTLQYAVEHDSIELHAQAICGLNGEDNTPHYEVLCTLSDAAGNAISPNDFVPAAEYFGLASLLDYHIVEKSLATLAKSKQAKLKSGWISINLSADTVCNQGALKKIQSLFTRYKVDPSLICFEVTETATLTSVEGATELLLGLKKLGCKIALDDFGSGFSSF